MAENSISCNYRGWIKDFSKTGANFKGRCANLLFGQISPIICMKTKNFGPRVRIQNWVNLPQRCHQLCNKMQNILCNTSGVFQNSFYTNWYNCLIQTRMRSSRMRTPRSLLYRGISVQGVSVGDLCPRGGVSVRGGFLSRRVSVRETPSPTPCKQND